jgi:hypothetical protein
MEAFGPISERSFGARLGLIAASLLLALLLVAPPGALAASPPRLTEAWSVDRDLDGRIDAVVLTFSGPVRPGSRARSAIAVRGWVVASIRGLGRVGTSRSVLASLRPASRRHIPLSRVSIRSMRGGLLDARTGGGVGAGARAGRHRLDAVPMVAAASTAGGTHTVAVTWSRRISARACRALRGRIWLRSTRRGVWTPPASISCGGATSVRLASRGGIPVQLRYRPVAAPGAVKAAIGSRVRYRVLDVSPPVPGGGDTSPGGGAGAPTPTRQVNPVRSASVNWRPLEKQSADPDTLFQLEPGRERLLSQSEGGLIAGNASAGDVPWLGTSKVAVVPGRFRDGLQSVARSYGYVWMPVDGMLPADEFTVEMWLKSNVAWSSITDNTPFAVHTAWDTGISVLVHGGNLSLTFKHDQAPAGRVSATLSRSVSAIAADTWVSVAFTYAAGTLRLYVDGQLAGEKTGVAPPSSWSDNARASGFSIAGDRGKGATAMTISDLRVSRTARVPGQQRTVDDGNDVTVAAGESSTGKVGQSLLGGLHTLGTPATEARAQGTLKVVRTDKMLTATPIVAGAPDATHPTPGVSGAFSYDWQVVDRTFDYLARLGVTPFISIDGTPEILGGATAPFSGLKLTSARSFWSGFGKSVPTDMAAWGQIVRDLVHHVTQERHHAVPYWGVWNEPDGVSFWSGTLDQYLDLYEVTANAVKSVDPSLKVGGPETAAWNPAWVSALVQRVAARGLPLDFVSWHYYSGNVGEIRQARYELTRQATASGIPVPEMIIGEWSWQGANLPIDGVWPFKALNYFLNDWHAAFTAASLIEMQRAGVPVSIYTNPVAEDGASGWAASGLMSSTHSWANWNVFRMWSMLAPDTVPSTYTGHPGVWAQASTDPSGRVTVLLSYLKYRKDDDVPLRVRLPASYASATVRDYVVDDRHSNFYDAGPAHSELEQLPAGKVADDGTVWTTLRPRSVHLLVIDR